MKTERITPRFTGSVIVAAPGPSLTAEVAERCKGIPTVAIKGAYELFPNAEVLYQCEPHWWDRHNGCPAFKGEKWSSHGKEGCDDKRKVAAKYGLRLVKGKTGSLFSLDPEFIHYGKNSGFQGINLALLMGGNPLILLGFDMRTDAHGNRYFNGKHPTRPDNQQNLGFDQFREAFGYAARKLPPNIRIINATPNSALKCFPRMTLDDALSDQPRY